MSYKDALLKELDSRFVEFKETFSGLGDSDMNGIWCGEWSTRDIIIHMSGWYREMSECLLRIGRGERPTPEGVDYGDSERWNGWFVSERKNLRVDQVIDEMEEAFAAYRAAAVTIPEERFTPGRTVDKILRSSGADHCKDHGGQIKDWRQRL